MQSSHALTEFIFNFPQIAAQWYKKSNYLCLLAVDNELQLEKLALDADISNVPYIVFKEPDLDYKITAIALCPGENTKRLVKNIKLALKDYHEKRKEDRSVFK